MPLASGRKKEIAFSKVERGVEIFLWFALAPPRSPQAWLFSDRSQAKGDFKGTAGGSYEMPSAYSDYQSAHVLGLLGRRDWLGWHKEWVCSLAAADGQWKAGSPVSCALGLGG